MAFSYWESNQWLEGVDLFVIGGGIVGLSAARLAKERHPHWRVVVLDQSAFGSGGSSKNAGFACFGSTSELLHDRRTLGDDAALELVRMRLRGLEMLRKTVGDDALGYSACGSVEFFPPFGTESALDAQGLEEMNAWIQPATGLQSTFQFRDPNQFDDVAQSSAGQAIFSPLEGTIDTGKMNRSLRELATNAGVDVLTGIRVERIQCESGNWQVNLKQVGVPDASQATLQAPHLILATNAFAAELLPELDVRPARNMVMVTAPVPAWSFHHSVHLDAGYVYARSIGNRMLIGGGRHWGLSDVDTESRLVEWLHALWPRTKEVPIEYRWSGSLGISDIRYPIVQRIGRGGVAAVRMGGMGVAIGMEIAKQAVNILSAD